MWRQVDSRRYRLALARPETVPWLRADRSRALSTCLGVNRLGVGTRLTQIGRHNTLFFFCRTAGRRVAIEMLPAACHYASVLPTSTTSVEAIPVHVPISRRPRPCGLPAGQSRHHSPPRPPAAAYAACSCAPRHALPASLAQDGRRCMAGRASHLLRAARPEASPYRANGPKNPQIRGFPLIKNLTPILYLFFQTVL